MITALFRTLLMYGIVLLSMKIMGKRQLGQMQVSELITAMILSELAALPISDRSIPFLYSLIPLVVIISLEVILSYFSLKSASAQSFLESTPTVIIDRGVLNQQALAETRVTLNELLVELRIAGLTSISDAQYVFLEPNGKFSVIPKAACRGATVEDLSLDGAAEAEPDVSLIVDGKAVSGGLKCLSKSDAWLQAQIAPRAVRDIFYFSSTPSGKVTLIPKETPQKSPAHPPCGKRKRKGASNDRNS